MIQREKQTNIISKSFSWICIVISLILSIARRYDQLAIINHFKLPNSPNENLESNKFRRGRLQPRKGLELKIRNTTVDTCSLCHQLGHNKKYIEKSRVDSHAPVQTAGWTLVSTPHKKHPRKKLQVYNCSCDLIQCLFHYSVFSGLLITGFLIHLQFRRKQ